ncbi:aldehyde dehydrogenase family protein [Umezawaea sp. NPDC059074]|uniref:aldehyde dehydrogenase family protein n=1 Tax=Umezawaea sp. NPDC059074 TaxID=3346716 RepID=UPI00368C758A
MTSTLTTRRYATTNPATGEVVRTFDTTTDAEAEALLARAHAAFPVWRQVPIAERARLFRRLADLIEANRDELGRLVTLEMGKPLAQSLGEIAMPTGILRYYADHGEELLADEVLDVPGLSRTIVRREPMGVTLGVEPWNGPMYQMMRATAPNLMLGNTVLLKPAEISAGSTLFFDHLFTEAGFPEHVYQTALVSIDQVSTYIADDRLRAVTLTGSDRAGSSVGEQAGRHVKPAVLELGGSDAFIVLDSADVPTAAAVAVACRLFLVGQMCISPKRIMVTDGVADEFIARFVDGFADRVVLGDPFDPTTTVGPVSSEAAADLLHAQYQDAVDKGATVLVPGGRVDRPGAFFQPAVLADITPDMRLYSEEAFGPLAMIYRVADADAAVELTNSSPYGLGGSVFGEQAEALRVAERLDTGNVGVNTYLRAPIEIPFGGTKHSGIGRELGRSGMDQFANIKTYGIA